MNAFILALKHHGVFGLTIGIGGVIEFIGKVTIAAANTLIAFIWIYYKINETEEIISDPVTPLIVVFEISYLIAKAFMDVYQTISLTILQCIYTDVDICK